MRFLFFVVIVAFALGCWSYAGAPRSVFPAISLARVEVFADAGTVSPDDLRGSVAAPLESAFASVPGVRATRAYIDQGKLEIELDFDPHGNVDADLRNVQAAIAGVRDRLPVKQIAAVVEGPNVEPVVSYALQSPSTGQSELRKRVEEALPPAFTGTPGLARITTFGGPRQGFDVDLDPGKLRAAGVSVANVVDAVASASRMRAAGTTVRGDERIVVEPAGVPRSFDAVREIAVPLRDGHGSIALAKLAHIDVRDESTEQQASFDATHAIVVNAYPETSADAVALAREVARRMPALLATLPRDTTSTIAWDQTRLITASQDGLRDEIVLGALIAIAIIYLFLRNGAMTLVAALVVPAAIVIAALVLVRAGLSLNLMTLGGLAIAVGLVIDEAIVVVEAVAREIADADGSDVRAAIERAVRGIARPLVTATAANVVVFLPLGFLSGIPGFFFRALSITLAIALVVSIALSLLWAPLLAALFCAKMALPKRRPLALERAYVATLRWCARRSAVVSMLGLAIFVASTVMLARLPTDFLPSVDEGEFEIKYALPAGMTLDAADRLATQLERAVLADPAVAHEARLSGVDTNGYLATPPDAGTIRVILRPNAPGFDRVADRLRRAIANVNDDVAVEVHQLLEDQINDLSGQPEPIVLTVRGPRQRTLTKIASDLADTIGDLRGIDDPSDGIVYEAREMRASPLRGSVSDPDGFANELGARAGGIVAADLSIDGSEVPVVVRTASRAPLEREVALGAPELVTQIQEENGARVERVTAGIENADLSSVIARVRHAISYEIRRLPRGYSIELGGAVDSQHAAFVEFALVLGSAVLLVFGVLVYAFDSFRVPLAILAAIPLAPIGVALALYVTRTPINVSSFMGMLLLVGIVVRNGILLVESANRRRLAGDSNDDALERAAVERLRPILMTTFAALGALVPLAIGIGSGSEMARPLAVAVAGGLVTSTALTLIFAPMLFASVVKGTRRSAVGKVPGGR